jgi:hypothetical protein
MDDKLESRQESKYGTLSHTFPCLPPCYTPYYCAPSRRRPSKKRNPPKLTRSLMPRSYFGPFSCFALSDVLRIRLWLLEKGISLPSHAIARCSLCGTRHTFIEIMLRGSSCGAGSPSCLATSPASNTSHSAAFCHSQHPRTTKFAEFSGRSDEASNVSVIHLPA